MPFLVSLLLLKRFYLFLLVDLTSVPESGGDSELGQDISLKRYPQNHNQHKPQNSHILSLW